MNSPSSLRRLLTVDEVADLLGLSTKTIRRRIDSGDIPTHRLGRAIRVTEADLLSYLGKTRQ